MRVLCLSTFAWNCDIWWRSLKSIGHHIFIERYDDKPHYLHSGVLDIARVYNPDFIVFSGAVEKYHGKPVLSPDILLKLKDIAPLVLICGDATDRRWWDLLTVYNDKKCFSLIVNIDGNFDTPISDFDNGLTLLTPIDDTLFQPKIWNRRGIKFGMIGRVYSQDRQVLIRNAIDNGLEFYPGDGTRPYHSMAKVMCDTKITFNIALAVEGEDWLQVKGRVVEAGFAGCCLFETYGSPTHKWFVPGVDYIEYDNLVGLIRILDSISDSELESMALRFRTKMIMNHSPSVFWDTVFKGCQSLSIAAE